MCPPRLRRPPGGAEAHAGHRRVRRRPGGVPGLSVDTVHSAHLPSSALGTLKLWATDRGLRRLDFRTGPDLAAPGERLSQRPPPPFLQSVLEALDEYLRGRRTDFDDIPLDLGHVTGFQERVYRRLREIPYGQVATYGDVARSVADGPGAARAVGQAVGANPVAIVIPCHRVVASDRSLHGFSGGLERKAALLRLEGIHVAGARPDSRVRPDVLQLPL